MNEVVLFWALGGLCCMIERAALIIAGKNPHWITALFPALFTFFAQLAWK